MTTLTVSRSVPPRSLEQRMKALERANEIRTHRAKLKREMKAGRVSFLDLVGDPRCQTWKVYGALMAMPKLGRVKVNRVLSRCQISPSRSLGGLTYRQLEAIEREMSR